MEFIENVSEKEYREFTEKNKTTHFLESYEWGELSKSRNFIPVYTGVKEKGKLIASALLLKKELPLGYSYYYIPRGYTIDYNNRKLFEFFTEELKKYCKKNKALFFRIDPDIKLHTIDENANPIEGENNHELVEYLQKLGFKRRKLTKFFETMQPRFTFRIPLSGSIEEIEGRYTKTTLQRIKKAEQSGIIVEKGDASDIKEFTRLMKMTEKRQDFYSHSDEFFENFYNVFSKKNYVTLYLGKIDIKETSDKLNTKKKELEERLEAIKDDNGKKANNLRKEIQKELDSAVNQLDFFKDKPQEKIVVSSYLIVNYGNKSWALYAANDMDYKNQFANYLVYKNQIRDAFNSGIEIFDVFGTVGDPNSTSSLVGLHDFKKKWGGEYTEFIGEFDYVLNGFMYYVFTKLIPLRHKIVKKLLKRQNNK